MNRRAFLATVPALCLVPAVPAIPDLRPIRIFEDSWGDNWYAARSAEDVIRYERDVLGVDDGDTEWRELSDHEMDVMTVGDEDGGPRLPLREVLASDLAMGVQVPYCIATTYV